MVLLEEEEINRHIVKGLNPEMDGKEGDRFRVQARKLSKAMMERAERDRDSGQT